MNYKKIKIFYNKNMFDYLIGMLYDNDIVNMVIEEDAAEPFIEFCLDETEFDKTEEIITTKKFLIEEENFTEEEMKGLYKEYYDTIKITDNITIVPEWENYEKEDEEIIVKLKSGMAWGNGQHETTTLCAEMLERYIKSDDKVIDVGTGTGILAIIARKLGAGVIKAVDIDKYSVETTKENLELNEVVDISVELGELNIIKDFKADVMVANIVAECIVDILKILHGYIEDGGIFISSGISSGKLNMVTDNMIDFEILEIKSKNDWNVVVARKK